MAQAQVPAWANAIGGTGYEEARGIAVARDGSIFITGEFEDTVDFDPGPGVFHLISAGYSDAFVAHYTNDGRFLAAFSLPGPMASQGYGVALAPDGTLRITGIFTGTVDLDPGPGTSMHTSGGLYDAYLCALTPDGNLLWADVVGGPNNEETRSVASDSLGNSFIVGEVSGGFDADPGPDTTWVESHGSFDAFVAKYDANGQLLWAQAVGGDGDDRAYDATVRQDGNVLITGYFTGTMDLDPGPGVDTASTPNQWSNAFLACYHGDGTLAWGRVMGGDGTDVGRGVAVDPAGNAVIAGRFARTAHFSDGLVEDSVVCTAQQQDADVFLAKYGPAGELLWVESFGGPEANMPRGVTTDRDGNIFLAGRFKGTIDLDPGPGTASHTTVGVYDLFLSKFDPQGNFTWGLTAGSSYHTRGLNVMTDAVGSVLLTGWITESLDMDPGPDSLILVSHGSMDAYLAKYSDAELNDLQYTVHLDNAPATTGWQLLDAGGQPLFSGAGTPVDAGQTLERTWQVPSGCYRIAVSDADGNGLASAGYSLAGNGQPLVLASGDFEALSTVSAGEGSCVPLGSAGLEAASCAQGSFTPDDTLALVPVDNATAYTLWFFDPHGSFSGTADASGTFFPVEDLPWNTPPDLPLNVRVRAWVDGQALPYGPACAVLFQGISGIREEAAGTARVQLSPNPTSDGRTELVVNGLPNGTWPVLVHDATGRAVVRLQLTVHEGTARQFLDLAPLADGFYGITVTSPKGSWTGRLIVSR